MLYVMETMAVTEKQVEKMEVVELKVVRWALGVIKNKIRNEYVKGTAKIAKLRNKSWDAMLRLYGHVKRREEGYVRKNDGDGCARQKEKRKVKEKINRFGERRHEKNRS